MKYLVIGIIKLYQKFLSVFFSGSCRFYPSCSQYAIDSLKKYGFIKGSYFSIKRIFRCNPFNEGGYDPVK